jgi:hypothetical protein
LKITGSVEMDRAALARMMYRSERGEPLDPCDGVPFSIALRGYLSGLYFSLDEALGLQTLPGKRSARTVGRTAVRDTLLRECAARCFPGLSRCQQAKRIIEAVRRYEASSWKFDRRLETMPSGYGSVREYAYRLCRLDVPMPKERRLIAILGVCNELLPFHCIGDSPFSVASPESGGVDAPTARRNSRS